MLSYQHAYHAGGAAGLHKHAALTLLLERLAGGEKPSAIVGLYAGHGTYDLAGAEAQKTKEFETGISRVWPLRGKKSPPAIKGLLAAVAALNPGGALQRYPGSPALARFHGPPAAEW